MRRTVGLILAGVGAFFIVMAIVLPTYIVPSISKFPLNEYETATLTASNVTYFSPKLLTVVNGANVTATYTVKGTGQGTSSRATWELFNDTYDTTSKLDIQEMYRKFSFDRTSTQIINCCGSTYNGTGNVGYVWPIPTAAKTYMVFDSTVLQTEPYRYVGNDTIDGISVYKFNETVAPTKITFLPLSTVYPEYATEDNTYWIDPSTGAILNVEQQTHRYLADPATGAIKQELFNADLKFTPATIQYVVGLDNSGRGELQLLSVLLPLVFGFGGGVALVAGLLLYRLNPREQAAPAFPGAPGSPDAVERAPSPRHAANGHTSAEPSNVAIVPGLDSSPDDPATA